MAFSNPSAAAGLLAGLLALAPLIGFADVQLDYEYDANGNLIKGDGKYYEYNDANRLVRVRHRDEFGPVVAEYFYDSEGRRRKKRIAANATYYIHGYLLEEGTKNDDLESQFFLVNGHYVAQKQASGFDVNMKYFQTTSLRSIVGVSTSLGSVEEVTRYLPFGRASTQYTHKYGFGGKEVDQFADQSYFSARYLNIGLRRFSQPDELVSYIYNPQNLNRYSYVLNRPVNLIDPSGYSVKDWWNRVLNFFGFGDDSGASLAPTAPSQPSIASGISTERAHDAPTFSHWATSTGTVISGSPAHTPIPGSDGETYEVDIDADMDEKVTAYRSGDVLRVVDDPGWRANSYGSYIILRREDGGTDLYAHLGAVNELQPGDAISAGDQIGTIGNSGYVLTSNGERPTEEQLRAGYGSHLHFEARDNAGQLEQP